MLSRSILGSELSQPFFRRIVFFLNGEFWWTSHIGLENIPGSGMQDSQLIRGDREPSRGNPNTQTWFIEEVESSLHDAVMAVKLAIRSGGVVT